MQILQIFDIFYYNVTSKNVGMIIKLFTNFQLSKGHGGDKNLAQTVLSKLPELRTIGARHVSYLEWFRSNWHMLKLPPLFAEIFDIPKCEEDLHQG